jgi:hypothetical protein
MYVIASMDRIRELKQEIAALAKLNALYKGGSDPSDFTCRANQCRSLRLAEIKQELGAMRRA